MHKKSFFALRNSTMTSHINEIYGESTLTQTYQSTSKTPIEVKLDVPLSKESILHKLTIQLEDKTVYARIKEKTKAKEAYSDSIASGNLAITGDYSEDDQELFQLNIGNIPPLKSITITTSIIQLVKSENEQYCFRVSPGAFPMIKAYPRGQQLIVTITSSKGPITSVSSNKNYSKGVNELTFNSIDKDEVTLFFTTPYHNSIQLFEEYDDVKDLYAYTMHYYYQTEDKEVNETPGIFYFLLDQSGSMAGKSIELAKNTLLLFLQSLPVGSYFYLIGFGSSAVEYTTQLMPYTEEGLKESNISNIIKKLDASLGGTELFHPLELIFNSNHKINLSKNVFVLTDGQISNAPDCYELISKHNNDFRIHAIGIGNDFDQKLIEKMGVIGKGTSSFVVNLGKLNENVVDALNKALKPYLKNVCLSIEEEKILEYPPKEDSNLLYKGEFYNYSFISKKKLKANPKVTFSAFDPMTMTDIIETRECEITKLPNGNPLNKTIVGQYLKNKKEDIGKTKKKMIRLSVEYQVLSPETTLIAEVELHNKTNKQMKVIDFTRIDYKPVAGIELLSLGKSRKSMNQQIDVLDKKIKYRMKKVNDTGRNFCKSNKQTMKENRYVFKEKDKKNEGNLNKQLKMESLCRLREEKEKDYEDEEAENVEEEMNYQEGGDNKIHFDLLENNLKEVELSEKEISSKGKKSEQVFNAIIQSQNMFDGSWDENNHTKGLITQMKDLYDKLVLLLDKKKLEKSIQTKIIFTYLVIRFINEKYPNKLQESKLIINKAVKYLLKSKVSYEDLSNSLLTN